VTTTIAVAAPAEAPRIASLPRVWHNPRVVVGLVIFGLFALIAVAAPLLAPDDPLKINPARTLDAPTARNLLGTDEYGRDVLSRLIYGARISLGVALSSVFVAAVVGIVLGLPAGFYGGWADWVVMRAMDLIFCFPPLLFAIAIVAFMGPTLPNLIGTIALVYVPRFCRVVYTSVLVTKHHPYVEASRSVGAPDLYLLWRVILPNIMAPIMVQTSLAIGFAILLESGLSFIGLGAQPPTPSWGQMIAGGRQLMEQAPYLVVWPSLVIALNIVAFNVLGDGLRDALDPRLRGN
jgi:peptide/nickel transport system permease protein